MTFAELKAAVAARGLDFQTDAQLGVWINDAYLELCDQEDWPFLHAQASGPAPLLIEDLGVIESVVRADGVKLEPADRLQLISDGAILSTTGSATSYFLA